MEFGSRRYLFGAVGLGGGSRPRRQGMSQIVRIPVFGRPSFPIAGPGHEAVFPRSHAVKKELFSDRWGTRRRLARALFHYHLIETGPLPGIEEICNHCSSQARTALVRGVISTGPMRPYPLATRETSCVCSREALAMARVCRAAFGSQFKHVQDGYGHCGCSRRGRFAGRRIGAAVPRRSSVSVGRDESPVTALGDG